LERLQFLCRRLDTKLRSEELHVCCTRKIREANSESLAAKRCHGIARRSAPLDPKVSRTIFSAELSESCIALPRYLSTSTAFSSSSFLSLPPESLFTASPASTAAEVQSPDSAALYA